MTDSKLYRTEVRTDSEYTEIPAIVEFSIDEQMAKEIIRLAAVVKANDLYKVERFDWRAKYLNHDPEEDAQDVPDADEESHVRTDADTLNVSDTKFWFAAYLKHTNVKCVSELQSIDQLAQHFGLDVKRSEPLPDQSHLDHNSRAPRAALTPLSTINRSDIDHEYAP